MKGSRRMRSICSVPRNWMRTFGLLVILLNALAVAANEYVRFIPAVASTEGRFGTFWTTDVWLVGQANGSTVEVEIAFIDELDPGEPEGVLVEVPWSPYSTPMAITDIVHTLFDRRGAGALLLRSQDPFVAWSRTTSPSSSGNGQVGQEIPALTKADLAWSNVITGVANDPSAFGRRTNVGVFNRSSEPGNFGMTLYSGDGQFLGGFNLSLGPYGWTQFDVFERTGNAQRILNDGFLLAGGFPRMAVYASVIDNASGDAAFLLPLSREDPRPDPRPECSFELKINRPGESTVEAIAYTVPPGVPIGVVPPNEGDWVADSYQTESWSYSADVEIAYGEEICASVTGEQQSGRTALILSLECYHYRMGRVDLAPEVDGSFDLFQCIGPKPNDP